MFTKRYFQDRSILFLNLVVLGLTALTVINSFLRIDNTKQFAVVRYRLADGLDGFVRADGTIELYTFAIAAVLFAGVAIFLSAKLYRQKRFMSLMLLSLTSIVLIFNLFVSFAIFGLQ